MVVGLIATVAAGCGAGGLDAGDVSEELSAVFPLPAPRDNTDFCAADSGCEQLITTDALSIYQWPDDATAERQTAVATDMGQQVHRAGPFVLRFSDEYPSSEEAIAGWSQRLDELVAHGDHS
ncbi:hypothetical protein FRP1_29310 (plasmid) [Pseudonocardia sp. EC080625-04]|nr:hypothetical protein FRP1_29310 [Pseudonocardia sp. EC080625-04]ALL85842.1 hypothetical protein AD017_32325 [Pseudonocardia sp. EC080619-01]